MKAAYVRPGGPLFPDQEKAKRVGLEQFFWDATDPQIQDGAVLKAMRAAGWKVGTTRDPGWTNTTDPKAFAALLSGDITRLAGPGVQHSVIADIEAHDSAYVLAVLQEFRRLRPGRFIFWTLEPLQGGWWSGDLSAWIASDSQTWVVPQLYRGNMAPVSERAVIADLPFPLRSDQMLAYYDRYEGAFNGIIFDWAAVLA